MTSSIKRLIALGILVPALLMTGLGVAHANKPVLNKLQPNEAAWGVHGIAMVIVFDVKVNQQLWASQTGGVLGPNTAIGSLRNVSDQPIQNITVTVGDHEDGDTVVYGSDSLLNVNLAPTDVWRWSVDPNKGPGYEVLGVSLNGQVLTKISTP